MELIELFIQDAILQGADDVETNTVKFEAVKR